MAGTGRHAPTPRFQPFAFYSSVRLSDPEMVRADPSNIRRLALQGRSDASGFPHGVPGPIPGPMRPSPSLSLPPILLMQLAAIMACDPYFLTQENGSGALVHFAVTYARLDMLHHLLNNGAEINQRDPRGLTPLHRAAHLAHVPAGGYLVRRTGKRMYETCSAVALLLWHRRSTNTCWCVPQAAAVCYLLACTHASTLEHFVKIPDP